MIRSPFLHSPFRSLSRSWHLASLVGALLSFFALIVVAAPLSAHAQQQCGERADADIVFMIDLSGSSTQSQIEQQKSAIRSMINTFAGMVTKPKIGLGTFNSYCFSYSECEAGGFNHARMVVNLSTNYTAALNQLQPNTGIQGTGSGGNGQGGVKLGRALDVANSHLLSHGTANTPNYIVVFNDGEPTLPGYYTPDYPFFFPCPGTPDCDYWDDFGFACPPQPNCCDNYICPHAEDVGAAKSDQLNAGGTSIFTVHFGSNAWGGRDYLRNRIATNTAHAYILGGNLQGIVDAIKIPIICDDGLSCTVDTCVSAGNCRYTETDSDGDGIGDCTDQCVGDNDLIGDSCDGSDSDSCRSGVWGCASGTLTCSDDAQFDDSDHDGIADCQDNCNGNNALIGQACDGSDGDTCATGVYECGTGTLRCTDNPANDDLDGDGIGDCVDGCPLDPHKSTPGVCGCGIPDTDSDGDGAANCVDQCPSDPHKTAPGSCGCGVADTDSDGDGTPNCADGCPSDPYKNTAGVCGCGIPDIDLDGDGAPDCIDQCPADPNKNLPGVCGCGVADTDTDGDGTPDCTDGCPDDAGKLEPGFCGCGSPDTDADNDGVPTCGDLCPEDPAKIQPGTCGCGIADVDVNGDSVIDCTDLCPNDPTKAAPGVCGCGVPDLDSDGDGVIDCGTGDITGSCDTVDIQGYKNALSTAATSQDAQLKRILRELSGRRLRCPNPTKVTRFIKRSKKVLASAIASNTAQAASLPVLIQDCPDSLNCSSVVVVFNEATYANGSDDIRRSTLNATRLLLQCKSSGGQCEGSVKECRRRSRLRRQQYQRDRALAAGLHLDNLAAIKAIPATTDSCS